MYISLGARTSSGGMRNTHKVVAELEGTKGADKEDVADVEGSVFEDGAMLGL